MEQDTLSLGVRWDLHSRAALKLQWDSTRVHDGGYGLMWRAEGKNRGDDRIDLVSITLDFVF